jgi:SAM-dependent methyltransferase
VSSAATWQEVECGGYAADLAVWEELARAAAAPVLELGSGGGRVALHLARRGHDVWAVDLDAELVATLAETARSEGLALRAARGDARRLSLRREFDLILAPMQLFQLFGGEQERTEALRSCARHLRPGGRLAAAIVEGAPGAIAARPSPLPDVRESDGWVFSSLPLGATVADGRLEIRHRRQAVSPEGVLSEEEHVERLELLDAETLELEASGAGLLVAGRRAVAPGEGHVGSTVVILERS